MRGERGAAPRCHGRFLQIQVFHSESRRLAAMHRAAGCKDDGASVAFRDPGLCGADREGLPGSPADGYDSPLSLPGVGLPLGYRVRKAVSLKPVYVPRMAISIPSSFCGRTSHWPGSQCSRPCDSRQHPANPVLPKLLEKLHTVQRSVALQGQGKRCRNRLRGPEFGARTYYWYLCKIGHHSSASNPFYMKCRSAFAPHAWARRGRDVVLIQVSVPIPEAEGTSLPASYEALSPSQSVYALDYP